MAEAHLRTQKLGTPTGIAGGEATEASMSNKCLVTPYERSNKAAPDPFQTRTCDFPRLMIR